jgi:hypothetical protein
MSSSSNTPHSVALFGRDHIEYGSYEQISLNGGSTACTISVGSDPETPSLGTKGGSDSLNEDALYARDTGEHVLLAVADAHFGLESSHHLIAEIERVSAQIPRNPGELEESLRQIEPGNEARVSESTLMAAVYDRSLRQGFGLTFGDSSLAIVGAEGARTVSVPTSGFLAPASKDGLRWHEGSPFIFFAGPGCLLLAFSDGINECNYGSPRTSVRNHHLHTLFGELGAQPELYARGLTQLALDGVDGHRGGEDNICLAVSLS